jgi:hypothetical protein
MEVSDSPTAPPESFWKRHGFLIAGVALPLLVVVGFALARALPRMLVAAPRTDLLYAVRSGYDAQQRKVDRTLAVVDGRLHVTWTKVENQVYPQPLHLYRFHASTGDSAEIHVPEPPSGDALERPLDLLVPGLDGLRVDASSRSPDGYAFENRTSNGGGVFGEMFGQGYRGPRGAISKNGRVILLPMVGGDAYGYEPVQFLGWLVPAGERR